KQMISFMIPLFIGTLFQQLYNTADAFIVGRMLGNDALAAVTGTGNLIFLMVSFFSGIAAGAGVVISRYYGGREPEKLQTAIHTSVAFGLAASLILTVLGVVFAPQLLRMLDTPEDIMAPSMEYFRIYFAGSLSLVMYNTFKGIMQAVGDSRNPLIYLIISSITNVVLDIVFIKYVYAGVGSAAMATIISQFLSAFLCMGKLMRADPEYRVYLRKVRFDWKMLKLIISFGLPSGLQNSVIAIANVVVQANINFFGTMAVAGTGAYNKLEGFMFMPVESMGLTVSTFVGQNLGARKHERARKGAIFGLSSTAIMSELMGLALFIWAPELISAFTQEPEAIAFGVGRTRSCVLFCFLMAISHALAAVLRGAGRAIVPMTVILSSWCVLRVIILEVGEIIFGSIQVVYWCYPITWVVSTAVLLLYFFKADWLHAFEKKKGAE
ncbi:MAG: MATE family efflux transporter, partial [Oscillospiraceae bacterium]|nr:MATE family efflux transporter [Oscillospiraceae bacterium]